MNVSNKKQYPENEMCVEIRRQPIYKIWMTSNIIGETKLHCDK